MPRIDWTRCGMWSDAAFLLDLLGDGIDEAAARASGAVFSLAARCARRADAIRAARAKTS